METYEITQLLLKVNSVYQVRRPDSDAVLMTVRGELLTASPKYSMVEGESGVELATLTGNFIKTKFQMRGAHKEEIGLVSFPAVAFRKTLVMTVAGRGYTGDGGIIGGVFRCVDNEGATALEIEQKLDIRHRFEIRIKQAIPKEVAILAAVAIHSRFFEG